MMRSDPESVPTGRRRQRPTGRSLATFAALVLAGVGLLLMTVAFLWPSEEREVDVGHIDRFEPGTVTSFRIVDSRAVPMGELTTGRVGLRGGVHIVRFDGGEVRAFSWRCTRLGHAVRWIPDFDEPWWDAPGEGVFRSSMCGSTWSMDGQAVFGPAPRALDGFGVTVTDQGRVVVDLGRVIEGARARQSGTAETPPTVTPTPAATPPGGR